MSAAILWKEMDLTESFIGADGTMLWFIGK